VDVVVVPWTPGPILRVSAPGLTPARDELRRPIGVPIDTSDPDVAALVDAYEAFWAGAPDDPDVIAAAHTALLEAASLLRWAPPAGPAEREYVRRHLRAITGPVAADPLRFLASL
jgi:hypothetical protein